MHFDLLLLLIIPPLLAAIIMIILDANDKAQRRSGAQRNGVRCSALLCSVAGDEA